MKKLLFKLLVSLISVSMVIAFSLSSCTTTETKATTAAETTAVATTAAETTAVATTAAAKAYNIKAWEGTEITVALDDRWENHQMMELIPQFEEATGIKVNLEEMPEATLFDKTKLDLEGGTGLYDVEMGRYTDPATYAPTGQLFVIDDFVKDPTLTNPDWFSMDNFFSTSINGLTYNGNLYGLPLFFQTNVLTIRTDIFEEKGITKPPDSYDELIDVLEKITDKPNLYGIGYRGSTAFCGAEWPWSSMLGTFGGKWFDENLKPVFNGPEGVKATELFIRLLKDYGAEGQINWHWAELINTLSEGNLGIILDVTEMRTGAEDPKISKVAGKLGTYFVPYAEETGERCAGFWIWGIMIPNAAKNKEASWQFEQWWTSTDVGIHSHYPSTKESIKAVYSGLQNPEGWPTVDEVVLESLEKYSPPDYRPRVSEMPEISDIVSVELNNVMLGNKTPQEALDFAAAEVEKLMESAGYYK